MNLLTIFKRRKHGSFANDIILIYGRRIRLSAEVELQGALEDNRLKLVEPKHNICNEIVNDG